MSHKVLIAAGAFVLAVGLLFSGCHRWKHHHGMSKERLEWFQQHLATKLNLNAEQKTKLSEIAKRFSDKFPDMNTKREKIRKVVMQGFESDKFDTMALNSELDVVQKDFTEMKTMMSQAIADFHAILTPEQRKKFVDLMKKHKERYNK